MAFANRRLGYSVAVALALATAACREEPAPKSAPPPPPAPRWTLAGRVSAPKGLPLSGVFVYAEGTSYLATTNEDGKWSIIDVGPGSYRLKAQRDDLAQADLGKIVLDPNRPDSSPPGTRVDLPLVEMTQRPQAGPGQGASQVGALRGVIRLLGGSEDYQGVLVQVAGTDMRTITDALGEYYISGLPAGDVRLIFSRKGLKTTEASATVTAGREMPGPIIELRPEGVSQSVNRVIRGLVEMSDLQGNPLAEFTSVVVSLEGTMHVGVPDSQGKFAFTSLPPGKYTVMATAPGFALKDKIEVDLTSLEATEVKVQLVQSEEASRKFGTVAGRAVFETPPVPNDSSGIIVSLVGTNLVAVTDPDGNYRIANVPPNVYLFRAQAEGQIPQFIERVDVKASEETGLPDVTLARYIVPPVVVYTDPSDGARDVMIRRDTQLYVRFSKRMRPETVKAAFSIDPPVAVRLFMGREHPQADFDVLYAEMLGTPGLAGAEPLHFSTTYRVAIADTATDFEDAHLEKPYTFQFTTGVPMIIATVPVDGDQFAFVSQTEPVVISFNAQMDHSKFSADGVRIRPEVGLPTIQAYDDPVTGWTTLRVYTTFDLDKEYTVMLRGNWRTIDNAQVGNMPYRLRFKTVQFYEFKPYSGRKE